MKLILNGKEEYILSDSGRDNYQFIDQSSLDNSFYVTKTSQLGLIDSEDVIDSLPYNFSSELDLIDFFYKLVGLDLDSFNENINVGSSFSFKILDSGSGDLENFICCGANPVETNGAMYSCVSYESGRLLFKVRAKDVGVNVYEKIFDICEYELGTNVECSLGFMRLNEENPNIGPNNKQTVFWIDIKTNNFSNYLFIAPDNSTALPTSGYTTKTLLPNDIYFVVGDNLGGRILTGTIKKIFAGPYFILRNMNKSSGNLNWIPYGNIQSMTNDVISFSGRNKYIQDTSYHNIKFCHVNYSDFSVSTEESEYVCMYGSRIEKSIFAVCPSSIDFSTTSDYSSYSIFHVYQTGQNVFGDCSIITDFDNQVCSSYDFNFKLTCSKSGKILKNDSHSIYDLPEFCFSHLRASAEYNDEEYYNPIGIHWVFNSQYDLNNAINGYGNTSNIPKNARMMYIPDIDSTFILTAESYNSGFTSCRLKITKYSNSFASSTVIASANTKPLTSWMMDEDKIDPYYSMALCYGDYCFTTDSSSNGGEKVRYLYAFWLSHESADDYFKVFFVTSVDDGETWSSIKYIDFSSIAGANEAVVDFGVDCCGGVMVIIPIIGQTKEDRYSNQLRYLNAYILEEPILATSSLSTPLRYSTIYPYKDIGPFSPNQSIIALPKVTTNKYLNEFYVSFVDASANGVGFVYGSSNGVLWSLVAVPDNRSPNGVLSASAELGLPDGSYPTFDVSGGMDVRDLSAVRDNNGFLHIVIEDKSSKMLTYFRVSPKYLSSIAKWNSVRMEANYISDTEVSLVDEEIGAIVSLQYSNVGYWDLRYKASDDNFGTVEKLRLINHDWSMFGNVATTSRIIGNMAPNLFLNNDRIGLIYMSGRNHPTTGTFNGNNSINAIFTKLSFSFEQGRYGSRNPFIYGSNSDTLYHHCDYPLIYPAFSKLGNVGYTSRHKTSIFPTGASDNHYIYFSPFLFNYQFPFGVDPLYIYDNMKGSIGYQGMKIRVAFRCPSNISSLPIMIHIHDYYKGASNYGSIRFILYYKPNINRVSIVDIVGGETYNTDFSTAHDSDNITYLDIYLQNARNDEDNSHTNIVVLRRTIKDGIEKYMNGNTSYENDEGIIGVGKAYKMLDFDDPLYSLQSFVKIGWTDDDPPVVATDWIDNVAIYIGRNDFPFTFVDLDYDQTVILSKDNVIGYPFSGISKGLKLLSYHNSDIVDNNIGINISGKNAFEGDTWNLTTSFDTASSSSTSVFFGGVSRFPTSATTSSLYIHVAKNTNGIQTSKPRYLSIIDTNIFEFWLSIKYRDFESNIFEIDIYDMTEEYGYTETVFTEFPKRKTLASKIVDIVYQDIQNCCLVLAAKDSLANNIGDYLGVFNIADMTEDPNGYGVRKIADIYYVKDHASISGMAYYNIIFEELTVNQNPNTDYESDLANNVLYCGIIFSNTCIVDLYKYITEDGERVYDILKSNNFAVESICINYDDKFVKSIGVAAKTLFSKSTEEYITEVSRSRYNNELSFSNVVVARDLEINKELASISVSTTPALVAQSSMSGESVSATEPHLSNSYSVESSSISKKDIKKKMLIRNDINRENEFIIVGYNDCEFGSFVDKCAISSPITLNIVSSDNEDTHSNISFQVTSTRTRRKGG